MKIKIKGDRKLFERWKKFDQSLASIVQNDMEITDDQLVEWRDRYLAHVKKMHDEYTQKISEISQLVQETALHIEKCRRQ